MLNKLRGRKKSVSPQPEPRPKSSRRKKMESFLKENLDKGLDLGKEGLAKGTLKVQHSLGLGQKPNAIPPGEVDIRGEPRVVEIGWHPVAGFAGKWFAEQTGLGKTITEKINRCPDPTQHWAVLVGDYVHQLWMDEKLDVIYINEEIVREEWRTFPVGQTRFSDEALRQAGEMVIHAMRSARPAYNLINNNCQNFASNLLREIQIGHHREFATAYSVYQRAVGRGRIKDLFVQDHPDDDPANRPGDAQGPDGTVALANQVMDEHTTKLDHHHPHAFQDS